MRRRMPSSQRRFDPAGEESSRSQQSSWVFLLRRWCCGQGGFAHGNKPHAISFQTHRKRKESGGKRWTQLRSVLSGYTMCPDAFMNVSVAAHVLNKGFCLCDACITAPCAPTSSWARRDSGLIIGFTVRRAACCAGGRCRGGGSTSPQAAERAAPKISRQAKIPRAVLRRKFGCSSSGVPSCGSDLRVELGSTRARLWKAVWIYFI